MSKKIRTRFAPSPTGMMHIGNFRTALYTFLFARHTGGIFILRIEDTDQQRYVEGAAETIFKNLRWAGIEWDEGIEKGGEYGPYVQSERKDIYKIYADDLVKKGHAYYCFCSKERLEEMRKGQESRHDAPRYDGTCRNLSPDEVERKLAAGEPYVIRQKMPSEGEVLFDDLVFGKITVNAGELEDQILMKSDGLPTYNFANVVDDHLMEITHVIRGSEYLSSTPKFNLLYEAFGWEKPTYIHLPVLTDEQHRKLSKRQGDVAMDDFIKKGYTKEAIVNYVALLGWNPGTEKEIFSMDELINEFSVEKIHKNPAVFDYKKLNWLNGQYLRKMPLEEFYKFVEKFYTPPAPPCKGGDNVSSRAEQSEAEGSVAHTQIPPLAPTSLGRNDKFMKISKLLHERVEVPADIPEMIDFLFALPDYDISLHTHKKMKTDPEIARRVLQQTLKLFTEISAWNEENIKNVLYKECEDMGLKTGQVMWPVRVALSGKEFTPGGAIEIADILGREESLRRLEVGIDKLRDSL
ncbi:MAG: glutamate--tRNA ligase [bacterium]